MPSTFPRCRAIPLADHQVSFQIGSQQRLRWHFGRQYERPFFFPLIGPSGHELTRIGHPGAPDHDHHRSIWFAHYKVLGIDFWSNNSPARIQQTSWLAYDDSDQQCVMAVKLAWYDGHDPRELVEQELVVAVRPGDENETLVEVQSRFIPTAELLEFGQTNFGFLAVRVAKHISAHFGGGVLTSSEGRTGEQALFAQAAQWMDYSGAAPPGSGVEYEGITYFDHPTNPGHPTHWHVRDDGWMGAAVCLANSVITRRDQPLQLRYLLHAHAGQIDADRAIQVFQQFASSGAWQVTKSDRPHQAYEVRQSSA